MLEQLAQLAQEYGRSAVVNNDAVPNQYNDGVIEEANNSIFSVLKKIVSEGGSEHLAGLFSGKSTIDNSNPIVKQITEQLTGSLGEKFGLSTDTSGNVAGNMIPQILSSLVGKAKDSNDSGFQISDIINAISGNSTQAASIMDTISEYGMKFGLDHNADGKVDVTDILIIAKSSGGISGFIGNFFKSKK